MNEKTQRLITILGAMGEMLAILRDGLMQNGFTRQEAMVLCEQFMFALIENGGNDDG